jgi:hypothetical protein
MMPTNEMQPTMPIGMSLAGFFTSSARVDTQSKPMKEKNTNEAPLNILQQRGQKGPPSRLSNPLCLVGLLVLLPKRCQHFCCLVMPPLTVVSEGLQAGVSFC